MISPDTVIKEDGSVYGTIKYVKSFPLFSNVDSEQKGNFFPLTLSETGSKMTFKKNGVEIPDKKEMTFDKDIIFRVTQKTDKYTVAVDGDDKITLNFDNATLDTEE